LTQDEPTLYAKIEEVRRRLDEVDRSISVLPDLAEEFGAASAGARLLETEAEQDRLRAELDRLRRQQEMQRLSLSPDTVREVLVRMRETLAGGDTLAKRALLGKLIVGLEIGKGQGKVLFLQHSLLYDIQGSALVQGTDA